MNNCASYSTESQVAVISVTNPPVNALPHAVRMLKAAFVEGQRILEAGIAAKASDLDVIWVNGYGLPRWRGGPLHCAQEQGWV